MRDKLQTIFEHFFYEQLIIFIRTTEKKTQKKLTQENIAERLEMSLRSYSDIYLRKTCCSALTLVLFLLYCCDNASDFLNNLREQFEEQIELHYSSK